MHGFYMLLNYLNSDSENVHSSVHKNAFTVHRKFREKRNLFSNFFVFDDFFFVVTILYALYFNKDNTKLI